MQGSSDLPYQAFQDKKSSESERLFAETSPPSAQMFLSTATGLQSLPTYQPVDAGEPSAPKQPDRKQHKIELTFDELIERSAKDAQAISKKLKDVIQNSIYSDSNAIKQAKKVVEAFNKRQKKSGQPSAFGRANIREGRRLELSEFWLAHRNKIPEIALATGNRMVVDYTAFRTESDEIGVYSQGDPFIGAHGTYIINVPRGKYAKAWTGTDSKPIIFNEGVHVVEEDPSFKFNKSDSLKSGIPSFDEKAVFVEQKEAYIDHGTLHILRVPQGHLARVIVNGKAEFLEHHEEPYVFDTPNFIFNKNNDLIALNTPRINITHQNLHILLVPPGQYAKVTLSGKPKILEPKDDYYVYDTPLFSFEDFVPQSTPYVVHGNYHILRVPSGHLANVWQGTKAVLLPAREEPYIFDDAQFRFPTYATDGFLKTDAPLIIHGSIKRIIPEINKVAIIRNTESKPAMIEKETTIDDPKQSFACWVDTSAQMLTFPSDAMKAQRRAEEKGANPDEINYLVFSTSDTLKIGFKLAVRYIIEDPLKAVDKLGFPKEIATHIEAYATADMGRAMQSCKSSDFLTAYQVNPVSRDEKAETSAPIERSPIDIATEDLATDLARFGIKLDRLNIESYKIIDQAISKQMQDQAVTTSKTAAEITMLAQTAQIAENKARQAADTQRIAQEQHNRNLIAAAEAESTAMQAKARGQLAAAETLAQTKVLQANADSKACQIAAETQLKIEAQRGKLFRDYPELLQEKLATKAVEAFNAIKELRVTPQQLGTMLASSGMGLFSMGLSSEQPRSAPRSAEAPAAIEEHDVSSLSPAR